MKKLAYSSVLLFTVLMSSSFAALPTSGLHFHYRADSLNLNDGDDVTQWPDSDSNLNNITLYPEAGKLVPTYVESAICGKPAVRFVSPNPSDPDSRTLLTSTVTWGSWGSASDGVCVFIVCTGGDNDKQQRVFQVGRTRGVVVNYRSIIADVSSFRGGNWFNNGEARKRSPFKKGEWIISIHEAAKDVNVFDSFYAVNSTSALQVDSFSAPGNFAPLATGNNTLLGSVTDKDGNWTPGYNGDVAEVIVYNRTLSTAEKQQVVDYLNQKYFLPAAHNPSPAKCAYDVGTVAGNHKSVTLTWNTGLNPDFININPAITHHHLYIAADEPDFTGVTPITVPSGGLATGTYGPMLLDLNRTYYWRVDEGVVSPSDPQTITGTVWSFTTGYPDVNPVSLAADPDILLVNDKLYVYPTSGTPRQYYVWSTTDLADWVVDGPILNFASIPWIPTDIDQYAWAPGMIERNGTYYMYFSVGPWPSKIGVAYSSSPMGPFTDSGAPLLVDDYSGTFESIDAMAFRDPVSGNYYLYAGGSRGAKLRMWRLNDDMVSFAEEIIVDTPPNFTEGAFMHYRDGIYYLSYSNGSWSIGGGYNVRYCTSSTPWGPWNYRGKILEDDDTYSSPGHHSVFYNGRTDEWIIVYHRWDPLDLTKRSVALDRLYYLPDGRIQPIVMTARGIGPVPLGKWLASDFNQDGSVGLPDLNDFCNAWLTADTMADISPVNGDGFVDLLDFELFSNQWGR